MDIQISVRNLVEFIFREGDIDNRHAASPDAMQDGSRIHRMIQKRMGLEYEAEVPLRYIVPYENYQIQIEGRADGVIHRENGTEAYQGAKESTSDAGALLCIYCGRKRRPAGDRCPYDLLQHGYGRD